MTIKNFTFFSPNGTEFPVGSNNDAKLYMMLTGMDYGTIRRKDWSEPINTALNVQYINTSIVAGGRYFELVDETVALKANSVNYIHANIDLTQTTSPVSLSSETINNSNRTDINNSSGVLKVLIDIRTTSGTGVIKAEKPKQVTSLDEVTLSGNARIDGTLTRRVATKSFPMGYGVSATAERIGEAITLSIHGANTAGAIPQGKVMNEKIPEGFRPRSQHPCQVTCQGQSYAFFDLSPDGTITYGGNTVPIRNNFRATVTYFTDDSFPA